MDDAKHTGSLLDLINSVSSRNIQDYSFIALRTAFIHDLITLGDFTWNGHVKESWKHRVHSNLEVESFISFHHTIKTDSQPVFTVSA